MRRRVFTTLAMLGLGVSSLVAWSIQENVAPIENHEYWTGLIEGFKLESPDSTVSLSMCQTAFGNAVDALNEAAGANRLWWDSRIAVFGYRGWVDWDDARQTPLYIRIYREHDEHTSDREIAITMTHEGLHWAYGAAHSLVDRLLECIAEEEEDPQCGPNADCGGGPVTTCTDEPYTYKEWDWVWTEIEAGSCVGVSPVALPGEEPGEPELHCTPATWGYVLMEVEKEGVRTVCVTTSN